MLSVPIYHAVSVFADNESEFAEFCAECCRTVCFFYLQACQSAEAECCAEHDAGDHECLCEVGLGGKVELELRTGLPRTCQADSFRAVAVADERRLYA